MEAREGTMPLFAIIARDKPNHIEVRKATREDHLAHLGTLGPRLRAAGPMLDEVGVPMGSLVIIEAGDEAEAREFAGRDPYASANLFESVEIVPWTLAIGAWAMSASDAAS